MRGEIKRAISWVEAMPQSNRKSEEADSVRFNSLIGV